MGLFKVNYGVWGREQKIIFKGLNPEGMIVQGSSKSLLISLSHGKGLLFHLLEKEPTEIAINS